MGLRQGISDGLAAILHSGHERPVELEEMRGMRRLQNTPLRPLAKPTRRRPRSAGLLTVRSSYTAIDAATAAPHCSQKRLSIGFAAPHSRQPILGSIETEASLRPAA
jgi:hypothetical protein